MKKLIWIFVCLITIAYPFLVYFGLESLSPRHFLLLIIPIFFIRWTLMQKKENNSAKFMVLPAILGLLLCFLAFILNSETLIKLYPAFMSFTMLLIFLHSFLWPPSIATAFAQRFSKEPLTEQAIIYTRKVTLVWCVFFLLNGIVAILTTTHYPLRIWTLYNGFISYMIMGSIFLGELMIRFILKRREKNQVRT